MYQTVADEESGQLIWTLGINLYSKVRGLGS